jgi:hypothetical protein
MIVAIESIPFLVEILLRLISSIMQLPPLAFLSQVLVVEPPLGKADPVSLFT